MDGWPYTCAHQRNITQGCWSISAVTLSASRLICMVSYTVSASWHVCSGASLARPLNEVSDKIEPTRHGSTGIVAVHARGGSIDKIILWRQARSTTDQCQAWPFPPKTLSLPNHLANLHKRRAKIRGKSFIKRTTRPESLQNLMRRDMIPCLWGHDAELLPGTQRAQGKTEIT